jgi:hypothetical protein
LVSLEDRTLLSNTNPPAILLLDPSGQGALTVGGSGSLQVSGGGRVVIDSNNASAAKAIGTGNISAQEFDITGNPGHTATGSGSFQGTIISGATAMLDPLASLPVPPVPSTT